MDQSRDFWLLLTLAFLLAGFVKGVIGLGLPTVAIGILGLLLHPAQAAALLVLPALLTNVWQLAAGPGLGRLSRRLWPLLAGVLTGIGLGGWLLDGAGPAATRALGAALVAYAAIGLADRRIAIPPGAERRLAAPVGALTGLIASATGVFVLPAVPFLQALGLDKDDLVQALGLAFTVATVGLGLLLVSQGTLKASTAGSSLVALAPAFAGMWLGQRLRARIHPVTFRRCFFAGLAVLGGHLAVGAA